MSAGPPTREAVAQAIASDPEQAATALARVLSVLGSRDWNASAACDIGTVLDPLARSWGLPPINGDAGPDMTFWRTVREQRG
ncbi:Uncharacterised protein (plasmid) [Tsukamurella tyrosinosolvens]|uniref:Uncharacterized protein n=1 Tax=Tsukamurella tyrosinosolvens TaxID=57704 RepID=A0A1H4U9D0_TSUTY|nr:hypothetical protein [Tsukamurella tyrosinosolvens]KXO93002.1 hypothetical protein AXK58_14120 [Tsukamurella tyrosinosolvens]SEC64804.1 hypothetical protein SAMN04489793_2808 [Tsukamurella tyrosinosolvens]VEH94045.1 Uncharacterised protein [Tsukamurella tyrosinosolvens]